MGHLLDESVWTDNILNMGRREPVNCEGRFFISTLDLHWAAFPCRMHMGEGNDDGTSWMRCSLHTPYVRRSNKPRPAAYLVLLAVPRQTGSVTPPCPRLTDVGPKVERVQCRRFAQCFLYIGERVKATNRALLPPLPSFDARCTRASLRLGSSSLPMRGDFDRLLQQH